MGLLDKLFGKASPAEIKEEPPKIEESKVVEPKPKKPRKPRVKKVEPEPVVEQAAEPRVDIVKVDFNKDNPVIGSFELDWNKEFVDSLRAAGYTGTKEEDIVDAWLKDVCRTIANDIPSFDNVRYINRRDLGDGKTEFS